MSDTITLALAFSTEAHAGQTDKAGRPYIEHVTRVHAGVAAYLERVPSRHRWLAVRENVEIAALLHDVIEDTSHDYASLAHAGFPDHALRRVIRLTGRPEGVSYLDNIHAMVREGDIGTMLIKLADVEDNADPERIAALPEAERGIARRYEVAARILREGLAARGVRL